MVNVDDWDKDAFVERANLNGYFKKKHAEFSEKRTFLNPTDMHTYVRPFALLATNWMRHCTGRNPIKNQMLRDCFQFLLAFQVKIGGDPEIFSAFELKNSRIDQVKFFKGCLPQILLGPFLNTLSHLTFVVHFYSLFFSVSRQKSNTGFNKSIKKTDEVQIKI